MKDQINTIREALNTCMGLDKALTALSDLEAEVQRLREALEKLTHYAECQVAAFSSGRPSLDMTLFPHLCANARAALKEQP